MLIRIVIVFLFMCASYSQADTFKVAAYSWEPFVDQNREDGGISIQLVRKILQTQGHDIELVPMPWARSLVMLEKNKIDILPAVWYKEERTKTMIYSNQYAANRLVFIKAKGSDYEYTGLESLHDKVVGVVRDYAYDGKILDEEAVQFSVSDSLQSNVKKVISGRVDLTLDDELAAGVMIEPALMEKIEFTQNALSEVPLFITCSKNNPKCSTIIEEIYPDISRVIMTDLADACDTGLYQQVQYKSCFPKPIMTEDLFRVLNDVFDTATPQQGPAVTESSSSDLEKSKKRILLVEDNLINQEIAVANVEAFGFDVDVANNGLEALEALKKTTPESHYDLILMDCQMPEMDGYEATRAIRKGEANNAVVESYSDITIIAFTANAMKGDKEKCFEAGMNDYVTKPINPEEIQGKLNHWLNL